MSTTVSKTNADSTAIAVAAPTAPQDDNPAIAYLKSLAPGDGRENKRGELQRLAFALWGRDIETAPWNTLTAANLDWVCGEM